MSWIQGRGWRELAIVAFVTWAWWVVAKTP